jgi:hypothetical protein
MEVINVLSLQETTPKYKEAHPLKKDAYTITHIKVEE